jgi:hypothetical protein
MQLTIVGNDYLPIYDTMCEAIIQCHSIDEVKDIHDMAIASKLYYKMAKNKEPERMCREIQLRAERKIGEFTRELPKSKNRFDKIPAIDRNYNETKAEVITQLFGGDSKAISNYERIAAIPQPIFEEEVKKPKASTSKLADIGKKEKQREVSKKERLHKLTMAIRKIRIALDNAVSSYAYMKRLVDQIDDLQIVDYAIGTNLELSLIAERLRDLQMLLTVKDTRDIPLLK